MTLPPIASDRAEAAMRLLNLTFGLHQTQEATQLRWHAQPRLGHSILDGAQVQRQATWMRMVSITEAFCSDRLLDVAEADVAPDGNDVRVKIWDKASTGAISSWASMKEAYNTWYGIKPDWAKVETLVEVRNAVAHGLGEITRHQRRKRAALVTKLTQANIALDGNRLLLTEQNLADARSACNELIEEVDLAVSAKTGRLLR